MLKTTSNIFESVANVMTDSIKYSAFYSLFLEDAYFRKR